MSKKMLTQKRLKELLHYDPETGVLTRIARTSNSIQIGDIAGGHSYGYLTIRIDNVKYFSHRLVWLYIKGEWPKAEIDHINHIRDDNRWINLRESTSRENSRNQSLNNKNTSGITGVYWHIKANKWAAYIGTKGKTKHLGLFSTLIAAVYARHIADIEYGYHPNHGK